MGLFDGLFGGKKEYPPLDQSGSAAGNLESLRAPLTEISGSINDSLEVIPAENSAYVFFGKPPKKFGIVWIEEGDRIVNFKSLIEQKGLSEVRVGMLSQQLGQIYTTHKDEPRYSSRIGEREIVVIPSQALFADLKKVVEDASG